MKSASRRERKTEHGVSDFDALVKALKAIKIEKQSIRSTASDYGIDKSSLSRYVTKFDKELRDKNLKQITDVSDAELMTIVRRIASYSTPKLVSTTFLLLFNEFLFFLLSFNGLINSFCLGFSMWNKRKPSYNISCVAVIYIMASALPSYGGWRSNTRGR